LAGPETRSKRAGHAADRMSFLSILRKIDTVIADVEKVAELPNKAVSDVFLTWM
jgi:hypothetical protein